MSKQLNILYQLERATLYKGIAEAQQKKNEELERSKQCIDSFSIKKFLEWVKINPGVDSKEYKQINRIEDFYILPEKR